METEILTDLYQACFYIVNGWEVLAVDCIPIGKTASYQITLQGLNHTHLAQVWYEKKAVANLWAFRSAYAQINSHVQHAKRTFDLARRYPGAPL